LRYSARDLLAAQTLSVLQKGTNELKKPDTDREGGAINGEMTDI